MSLIHAIHEEEGGRHAPQSGRAMLAIECRFFPTAAATAAQTSFSAAQR
jgi:hypothetical protein